MEQTNIGAWLNLLTQIGGDCILKQNQKDKAPSLLTIENRMVLVWERQPDGESTKLYIIALFSTQRSRELLTMLEIEDLLAKNFELFDQLGFIPKAADSYLILLYPVEEINSQVFLRAMEEEEITTQFKRYMLYYTEDEFNAANQWIFQSENRSLDKQLLMEIDNLKDDFISGFLKRVLIKVPFFNLVFAEKDLPDFSEILTKKLEGIKKLPEKECAMRMNKLINDDTIDSTLIACMLFEEVEKEVEEKLCSD